MLELAREANIPRLTERGLPGHEVLQTLLDRALNSDREMRFATAHEMLEALDSYLVGQRFFSSQLRFASFLTDHFSVDLIHHRRERELAARALAMGPAATLEPIDPPLQEEATAPVTHASFGDDSSEDVTDVGSRAELLALAAASETTSSAESLSIHASTTIPLLAVSKDAAEKTLKSAPVAAPVVAEAPASQPEKGAVMAAQTPTRARSFAWLLIALCLAAMMAIAIWWVWH